MPERLECEVIQKARYINTLTFTFTYSMDPGKKFLGIRIFYFGHAPLRATPNLPGRSNNVLVVDIQPRMNI